MWDEEVDVVCIGSGIAGLAHAVAIVDKGGEVFVTDSRDEAEPRGTSVAIRSRVDRLQPTSTSRPCRPTSAR
jgi:2-polyprenyl-6-methoxyphenol hydroxylase-like FAD-dependent oxidoreductase